MPVVAVVVAAIAMAALDGCDRPPWAPPKAPKDERVTFEVATPLTNAFERDHPKVEVTILCRARCA